MMIPLKRALYPPNNPMQPNTPAGNDILAIKRVVSRAGFWPWQEFDKNYSNAFAHGITNRLGIKVKGQEGVEGLAKKLQVANKNGDWLKEIHIKSQSMVVPAGKPHSGEPIWDQFSINLYRGYEDLNPAQQKIKSIFEWWQWLTNREPAFHYSQVRPVPILRQQKNPPTMPNTGDCSGTFIVCAWLAGAMSPDKSYGYSGYGNTDSLIRSGKIISKSEIDKYCQTHYVGVFYGNSVWDTTHMTAAKSSSVFYSHGKEAGPEIITNINYHPKPVVGIRAYPVL